MADPILVPTFGFELTPNGVATEEFHIWMDAITDGVNNVPPLTGSGTPEASVVASVGRWYVDTVASPADIYFKKTGDGNTGWVITS